MNQTVTQLRVTEGVADLEESGIEASYRKYAETVEHSSAAGFILSRH